MKKKMGFGDLWEGQLGDERMRPTNSGIFASEPI